MKLGHVLGSIGVAGLVQYLNTEKTDPFIRAIPELRAGLGVLEVVGGFAARSWGPTWIGDGIMAAGGLQTSKELPRFFKRGVDWSAFKTAWNLSKPRWMR